MKKTRTKYSTELAEAIVRDKIENRSSYLSAGKKFNLSKRSIEYMIRKYKIDKNAKPELIEKAKEVPRYGHFRKYKKLEEITKGWSKQWF